MIYLLTAIGLTPGGSSTVHIYTQTIHRTTQLTILVGRLSGIRIQIGQTNWEECGPCPVFASYTLAFAFELRKKHRETSVRVAEECQLARWKRNTQNRTYITIRIHKHNNKIRNLQNQTEACRTHTHTHTHIYIYIIIKKKNQKNMKECDERKSHISSKLHMICTSSDNVRHPDTKTSTTLHPTTLYSSSLHLSTLHFLPSHHDQLRWQFT